MPLPRSWYSAAARVDVAVSDGDVDALILPPQSLALNLTAEKRAALHDSLVAQGLQKNKEGDAAAAAKLFGRACTMQRTVTTKLSLLNMTLKAGTAPALAAAGYLRLMEDLELTEREWRMAQSKLAEANAQLATLKEQHAAAAGLQARARGRSARRCVAPLRLRHAAATRLQRAVLRWRRFARPLPFVEHVVVLRLATGGSVDDAEVLLAVSAPHAGCSAVEPLSTAPFASHALDGHAPLHFVVTTRQAHVLHGVALRVAGAVPWREGNGVENGDGDADESGDGDGDGGERPPALGLVAASAYSQSAVDNLYGRAAGGGAGRDADDACVVLLSRLAAPTTLGAAAAAFRTLVVDAFSRDGAEGGAGALERAARAAVRQPGPRADGFAAPFVAADGSELVVRLPTPSERLRPGRWGREGVGRVVAPHGAPAASPAAADALSALARLGHAAIGTLLSALLLEQKILLVSGFPSRLTAAAEALRALAFPLVWERVYAPLVPPTHLAVAGAPFPYILGVPAASLQLLGRAEPMEGEVWVLLDSHRVLGTALAPLPPREAAPLRKALQSGGRAAVHAAALPRAAAACVTSLLRELLPAIAAVDEAMEEEEEGEGGGGDNDGSSPLDRRAAALIERFANAQPPASAAFATRLVDTGAFHTLATRLAAAELVWPGELRAWAEAARAREAGLLDFLGLKN